ncbi:hypothetical protein PDIG_39710 [Penicillium digitatum PHI26]|uniref:Uncharacterized protein n=2 Tax=Penicillium digitatum TaxID=36651 RepID=K9FX71_PEND2|nr:hypothetical protein PDIP_25250 [Penicillium digitatum Pd1]EKV13157.1 hypothetical protein PDIG_39710 [Penicillium digitatum PHI26]EKV18927.1 hypothetical protein PDIP_25250 [Penicillium digitatum Pd1]
MYIELNRKLSGFVLVVLRHRWDTVRLQPHTILPHRSTHDHHNPNPDMRQLTNPAVDTSDGRIKPTPQTPYTPYTPTLPSRDVIAIDTHVPQSRAKRS